MADKNGIFQCARFAHKPNQLKYCGPDQNRELFDYLKADETDINLEKILEKFESLFPYLKLISSENKIENPFDEKVVEAYWIGNDLLKNIKKSQLYSHLRENTKLTFREKIRLGEKLEMPDNIHHSFHVFNVWKQSCFAENPQILKMMDECRIGWGLVTETDNEKIKVLYEPVIFSAGKLEFGAPSAKEIACETKNIFPKINEWISFHWSSYCKTLSPEELKNLRKWTNINMNIRNAE